jgi:hypothetical protein
MAKDDTASIITLHQVKRPKTGADRARAYRERKKGKSELATVANLELPNFGNLPVPTEHAAGAPSMLTPVTPLPPPIVTFRHVTNVTPSRRSAGPVILMVAALGLAAVGICTNAWYARSLGATERAGTLFLAVGVASDLVALVCHRALPVYGNRASAPPRLPGGCSGLRRSPSRWSPRSALPR